jgi:hypothetical protein
MKPSLTWLSESDVAQRFGVSVWTVQRMRKDRVIKAKKLGGRWKYREDWLREFEDQEDTPCRKSSGLEGGSLIGDPTAQTGARAGTIQALGSLVSGERTAGKSGDANEN